MSPNSSNIPSATDNTIASATLAAETTTADAPKKAELTEEQKAIVSQYARGLLHSMTRHNTPFDGRKRKAKVAKAKNKRKANKKRKLYVRYGKQ